MPPFWHCWFGPHTLPHAPQLFGSVPSVTQTPLQSVLPLVHLHMPPWHCVPPWQTRPHWPQFRLLPCTSMHAPLQMIWLPVHIAWHVPPRQTWFGWQAMPQVPQFWKSFVRIVQTPLHAVSLPGHAHVPAEQNDPPAQVTPQPPQSLPLVSSSTQAPLQRVCEGGQLATHAPPLHTVPPVQAWAQPPQLFGSVCVLTQAPPHGDVPGLHVHWLPMQFAPAGQTVPHAPQFLGSITVSTQAPLQLCWGEVQVAVQTPLLHTSVPVHALLHVPQWAGSVSVAAQVPPQLCSLRGQAQWPAAQIMEPQLVPQVLQLAGSDWRSTHDPLQLVRPWPQIGVHVPALQTSGEVHVVPHPPQLPGSLAVSTHWLPQAICGAVQVVVVPVELEALDSLDALAEPPIPVELDAAVVLAVVLAVLVVLVVLVVALVVLAVVLVVLVTPEPPLPPVPVVFPVPLEALLLVVLEAPLPVKSPPLLLPHADESAPASTVTIPTVSTQRAVLSPRLFMKVSKLQGERRPPTPH